MPKRKTYSGKYTVKNKRKYECDWKDVVYRSSWERQVFRWCDSNPDVVKWSSEEVVIPYICKTDNKPHRYFMDIKIRFKDGKTLLVEVKPKAQTEPPRPNKSGRKTRRYITETMTYVKNISKWKAAAGYAADRGWDFQIWTEETLTKKLGLKIL